MNAARFRIVSYLRRNPLQSFVLFFVLAIHLSFVVILVTSPHFSFRKKERKSLIVKTIIPKSTTKIVPHEKKQSIPSSVTSSSSKAPENPEKGKKQGEPSKNLVTQPIPSKKEPSKASPLKKEPAITDKTISKKPPPVKKTPSSVNRAKISDELWQQLEEGISKMDKKDNKPFYPKIPSYNKSISPIILQIDTVHDEAVDSQNDYVNSLIECLQSHLILPDYGEVKIQLNLRQDGTVAKLVVLKAQSEKNKQYLESKLPHLKFPLPKAREVNPKECMFILTFCNE